MFRNLRLKKEQPKVAPDASEVSLQRLIGDPGLPVSLRLVNGLPPTTIRRFYRTLLPPNLLTRFDISPISWKGPDGDAHVQLIAEPESGEVKLYARHTATAPDPFFTLELADNTFNGIDLHMLIVSDPNGERYNTDTTADGQPTHFGTARRSIDEELRAMNAGLAPGQTRPGLNASGAIFPQLDALLILLAHSSLFLEPLTYASAWVFERRGFAYVRGHKLMDTIHTEFQPGGKLHAALDGSTPFRQPQQWNSIRGRAWAIQDGILNVLDTAWTNLRMVKQVGRHAGAETAPGVAY